MRYIDFSHPGGPEVLHIAEREIPKPKQGEVLIRVAAAGVNSPDLQQRLGKYSPPPDASPILGLEVAGTIEDTGERVCALAPGGGYAEYCVVPKGQCLPIPLGLSMDEAAGIPETYFTVWANVFQIGRLKSGEQILIHGGAGGIGTSAIQLARAFGATVLTTAGSAKQCDFCLALGAKRALNYREHDFVAEFRDINLILDVVGGTYTPRNIECLAPQGRLVQIGVLGSAEATINLWKIMEKRLTVTGSTMRPRTVEEKAQIARELRENVWPLLESRAVKVVLDRVFPLEQAAEAHRYLEAGEHIGKVILKVA